LLDPPGTLFIVPATQRREAEFLACGGGAIHAGQAYAQCAKAVIAQAQADKAERRPFCRLARDPVRLEELLSGGTCASKLLHLFSRTPERLRALLQLDSEARFSVTDEALADSISSAVLRLPGVDQGTLIVDATACVGGNALSFAKTFSRVIAIETDASRLEMLRHNAALLGREAIEPVLGDCLKVLPQLQAIAAVDFVVFLDPPWGGLNYKDLETCELQLSGISLRAAVDSFLRLPRCSWCVCKVPFNFNFSSFTTRGSGVGPVRVISLSKSVKLVLVGAVASKTSVGGGAGAKRTRQQAVLDEAEFGEGGKDATEAEVDGNATGDAAAYTVYDGMLGGGDGMGASGAAEAIVLSVAQKKRAKKKAAKKAVADGQACANKNVRKVPTQATRELNTTLSRLARGKQLSMCRSAFAAASATGLADAWSHAIMINAYASCGDGDGALAALSAMREAGHRPCVMSYTAALKAPCALGELDRAKFVLTQMEDDFRAHAASAGASDDRQDWLPNVRTANTFFRGCLVAGGVADAVALLARLGQGLWESVEPDASSFEYVGTLCAQALQLDKAARLAQRACGGDGDSTATHASARVRLAICRSAALIGAWKRCCAEAAMARALLEGGDDEHRGVADGHALFRQHQREEVLGELDALEVLAAAPPPRPAPMALMLRRIFPLPSASGGLETSVKLTIGALQQRFGLDSWCQRLTQRASKRGEDHKAGESEAAALRSRLHRVLGSEGRSGPLDLDAIFSEADAVDSADGVTSAKREYRLELGCGVGEWLVAQAAAAPKVFWLGLELMSRRAHATAARLAFEKRSNVAALIGDATHTLERWIPAQSLEAIYVNHPEPPHQALTKASTENAVPEAVHMLDDRLFTAAAAALKPGGTLTIVTDNVWYAELLLSILARHSIFEPAGSRAVESKLICVGARGVELVSAQPGAWCRHEAAGASSYFDRLWKTGLSVHSAVNERFVIHVRLGGSQPAAKPKGQEPRSRKCWLG